MAMSYLFQFLDKAALSYTAILGLKKDLSLTGSQYSWASGIYYFGYLAASYPAGMLMVRFPVGKLIAASVQVLTCVSIVLALTDFQACLGHHPNAHSSVLQCSRIIGESILPRRLGGVHRTRPHNHCRDVV